MHNHRPLRTLRRWHRRVWCWAGLVWRRYPGDERIQAATAWEVACIFYDAPEKGRHA